MISKDFLLAGRAIFTAVNASGERYTFRVSRKAGVHASIYFGAVLQGADRANDYRYVGIVDTTRMRLSATKKGLAPESRAFRALDWILMVVDGKRDLPEGYALMHAGRCGRCGRLLTVPESIVTGLGPECAEKMGL